MALRLEALECERERERRCTANTRVHRAEPAARSHCLEAQPWPCRLNVDAPRYDSLPDSAVSGGRVASTGSRAWSALTSSSSSFVLLLSTSSLSTNNTSRQSTDLTPSRIQRESLSRRNCISSLATCWATGTALFGFSYNRDHSYKVQLQNPASSQYPCQGSPQTLLNGNVTPCCSLGCVLLPAHSLLKHSSSAITPTNAKIAPKFSLAFARWAAAVARLVTSWQRYLDCFLLTNEISSLSCLHLWTNEI